jgi:hypothetical protein
MPQADGEQRGTARPAPDMAAEMLPMVTAMLIQWRKVRSLAVGFEEGRQVGAGSMGGAAA